MSVLLINPNSNRATTEAMCRIAGRVLGTRPDGWTASGGPQVITTPEALDDAARAVASAPVPEGTAAVMVAAFGDPGAEALASALHCPVIGIGAASVRAASAGEARFAVVTTTAALSERIDALVARYADARAYLGCFVTPGDPAALMADTTALENALCDRIAAAVADGASRVIIGGGPLGEAADRLMHRAPVPLINPVAAAAQEILDMTG